MIVGKMVGGVGKGKRRMERLFRLLGCGVSYWASLFGQE